MKILMALTCRRAACLRVYEQEVDESAVKETVKRARCKKCMEICQVCDTEIVGPPPCNIYCETCFQITKDINSNSETPPSVDYNEDNKEGNGDVNEGDPEEDLEEEDDVVEDDDDDDDSDDEGEKLFDEVDENYHFSKSDPEDEDTDQGIGAESQLGNRIDSDNLIGHSDYLSDQEPGQLHHDKSTYKDLCKIIKKTCKEFRSLSDGHHGSSTNGELSDKSCHSIVSHLNVTEDDVFMDIGSGSGVTLLRIAAISKCRAAIGIEIEPARHRLAMLSHFGLASTDQLSLNVTFDNDDILNFQNFNGVTKIFMFSAVFVPELMDKLSLIFNCTSGIITIACNHDLKAYGYNVDYVKKTETLGSFCGKINYQFHIFQKNDSVGCASLSESVGIRSIQDIISVAVDEDMRKKKASDYHSNFLASNLTTKVYKSNQSFPAQSLELFTLLTSGGRCSDPVVKLNGKDYVGKKSRKVIYFNRVELAKSNFFTCEAICKTNKSKGRALIVPSFNGT